MNMVEMVATALVDADPSIEGHHKDHIQSKLPYARSAIAAMREPAAKMIEAGIAASETWAMTDFCHEDSITDIWRAMIDTALMDGEK